ncbi:MAG: hypothetical protein EPO07_19145 [Verrucomicrobia bacterium]|nr:MAG: hypothetical protein EPO07_19145 [Verrucomicrobiota bacterium]
MPEVASTALCGKAEIAEVFSSTHQPTLLVSRQERNPMDITTGNVVVTSILALVFVAFFAVFRSRGKGKIKGPWGTGIDVEGSNEPQPTRVKEVEAGGNVRVTESSGRGVDASRLKAQGDVEISSSSSGGTSPPKK